MIEIELEANDIWGTVIEKCRQHVEVEKQNFITQLREINVSREACQTNIELKFKDGASECFYVVMDNTFVHQTVYSRCTLSNFYRLKLSSDLKTTPGQKGFSYVLNPTSWIDLSNLRCTHDQDFLNTIKWYGQYDTDKYVCHNQLGMQQLAEEIGMSKEDYKETFSLAYPVLLLVKETNRGETYYGFVSSVGDHYTDSAPVDFSKAEWSKLRNKFILDLESFCAGEKLKESSIKRWKYCPLCVKKGRESKIDLKEVKCAKCGNMGLFYDEFYRNDDGDNTGLVYVSVYLERVSPEIMHSCLMINPKTKRTSWT